MAKKILIVEDDPSDRAMVRNSLEPHGYEIIGEADDGDVAIEKFKELKPDLVTLDLIMPRVDGLKALREMVKVNPQAKVIVITRVDQRDTLMQAIKLGAEDYIVKPIDKERVFSAVRKALGE